MRFAVLEEKSVRPFTMDFNIILSPSIVLSVAGYPSSWQKTEAVFACPWKTSLKKDADTHTSSEASGWLSLADPTQPTLLQKQLGAEAQETC